MISESNIIKNKSIEEKTQKKISNYLWNDVETTVAKNDMCCGCGVCAYICPTKCITIDFNKNKEYKPFVNHNICINCGTCRLLCPDDYRLYNKAYNQTYKGSKYYKKNELIGPFLEARVGFVNDLEKRLRSASGGILTALLTYLLDERIVDGVVVTQSIQNEIDRKLCESVVVYSSSSLIDKTGSRYYPIEFSKVLNEIVSSIGKTYAIVGVPCVSFALRKLMLVNVEIKQKIKYLFALACGHNVSTMFTTYMGMLKGLLSERCMVQFRDKDVKAADFLVTFKLQNNDSKSIPYLHGNIWSAKLFSLNKCLYCTDFWGEFSDASFSDAWLPEYVSDPKGTSIVVVRNNDISSYLDMMVSHNIATLNSISEEKVVESQIAQVRFKKEDIKIRIALRRLFNKKFPDYRMNWHYKDLLKVKKVYHELKTMSRVKLSKIAYRYGILQRLKIKYFLLITDPMLIPYKTFKTIFIAAKRCLGKNYN